MEILSLYIDGYKNISEVKINLVRTISAFIGFNNSGKSNLIQSIIFGFKLMQTNDPIREELLKTNYIEPALEKFNHKTYSFEVKFSYKKKVYTYKLQADWNSYCVISEDVVDEENNSNIDLIDVIKNTVIATVYKDNDLEYYVLEDVKHKYAEDDCYLLYQNLNELKENNRDRYEILLNSFLNLFPELEYVRLDYNETIYYKEKFLDSELPLKLLSSGPQKIFKLLTAISRLKRDSFSLVFFEEVENSIHPILIENLLIAIDVLAVNSKILITSHSPYLIQHINLDSVYLAIPSNYGRASFKTIRNSEKLLNLASEYDQSTGEFIFNLMLEAYHQPERLLEWL